MAIELMDYQVVQELDWRLRLILILACCAAFLGFVVFFLPLVDAGDVYKCIGTCEAYHVYVDVSETPTVFADGDLAFLIKHQNVSQVGIAADGKKYKLATSTGWAEQAYLDLLFNPMYWWMVF